MKKFIIFFIVSIMMFSLVGCSAPEVASYTSNWGKSSVNEVSTYKVTIDKVDELGETDKNAPILFGEGTYVTTLTGDIESNYTFKTELKFDGYYQLADGGKVDVNDSIVTEVVFKDSIYDLSPLSSMREYNGTTVVFENNQYQVKPLSYKTNVIYNDNKATVKTSMASGEAVGNIPTNMEIATKKALKAIDNEQILLAMRSLVKKPGQQASINVVSGLSTSIVPMNVTVNQNIIKMDTNINGVSKEMDTYHVQMVKSDATQSGTAINCFYGMNDTGTVYSESGNEMTVDMGRLIKMQQFIPYSNSALTYDLVEFTSGK